MVLDKLSKFSFEEISESKHIFSKLILEKLNEWIQNRNVLKDTDIAYLPDHVKPSIENLHISLKRSVKQNALKQLLEKIDDFDDVCIKNKNENFILGDNLFNNIKNLYNKFRNDKDCMLMIDGYIENKILEISSHINKAFTENNIQSFLNNIELVCTINVELNPIIENIILKNKMEQLANKCLNIAKQTFKNHYEIFNNQIQKLNPNAVSDDIIQSILEDIKINFEKLNLFVKLQKRLSLRNFLWVSFEKDNYFENQLCSLNDKLEHVFEECKRNLLIEMNNGMFDAIKVKILLEYMEFISKLNLNLNYNITDFKNLIEKKLNGILEEIKELIEDLRNISTSRHFQNHFDEIFKKMNLKLNFLNGVEINLINDYFLKDKINKVKELLISQISSFFINLDIYNIADQNYYNDRQADFSFNAIDSKLDKLLNSYNDNEVYGLNNQNIHEFCNLVYNSYFGIISFKNNIDQMYLQFFSDMPNIEENLTFFRDHFS